MAIKTRDELVDALAIVGITGLARSGDLDALFQDGSSTPEATTTVFGTVKKSAAVPNLAAQTVTDIATAQTAINAIVTKLNALLSAQRTAGQLS